ncbi:tRNA-Thr(GGU) m(6)t(6)A37 methyltransferase TsaA [Vibrio breoganii]|uniref:tRNA (N6-threonylcarbamoyladenosine(37)-N6)-methyltransferase TrmO n=1 Tax=Vibrio breoganii TaxID=553239 RepID=UPI000C8249A9|nr:tRNA (N6-threonylcarbamoyladenosine(37)-N6)-methyltransferase TrmO [Vibrio breoganii]PMG88344.1 tRNA-Thr(GGU) m(6)t(6)A37 methyltransferase TsaA [Vibrio breoganii]PML90487.1 tRNA-Thr(GGU) m(6)t(6)A37 methyltransferase TsaA [Vibrio breoganii]PMP01084.1 tRNA-Thr(GGU) m(6)t(6)A37 methyltransferase TsaA [Vibrio breoganii]TKG29299.1 tRNA (N6-threonylcarbamoyladenosine(37)-N6)-methyltransferase TrmO [Vibrio breoganii]
MTKSLHYIGEIQTPYTSLNECPNNIQPQGPDCQILLSEEFEQGLDGLQVGTNILILYWLADAERDQMIQSSRSGNSKGVFALRSPHRPNPIGAAVLPIKAIEGNKITVKGLDCLNGTPLLDIKPAIYREGPNTSH